MADTTQEPTDTTFADIRAILRTVSEEQAELARQMKEQSREADRRRQELDLFLKEQSQAAERRRQELDLQMQETDRLLKKQAKDSKRSINQLKGVFTSQWGELVESLVQGDLVTLLQGRGVAVTPSTSARKAGATASITSSTSWPGTAMKWW